MEISSVRYSNMPETAVPCQNEYYNLGTYRRHITTTSKHAQAWFNRGLIWSYAFNHEEAVKCFRRAIAHDPDCAMAYWGIAHALGPNYNKPWGVFDIYELGTIIRRGHRAIKAAKLKRGSPVEMALIDAMQFRYPSDRPAASHSSWTQAYAFAMKFVYDRFPGDLDIAVLYAEALMNVTPWGLWDLRTGLPPPGARTLEIKSILETALAHGGDKHPGVLHLYVHLMEMSASPEQALTVADQLRGLVPDAGHLEHMPTHLDIICGDYRRAISSNTDAIIADEKFFRREGGMSFYTLYRAHNAHFRLYAAMFAGRSKVALDTVSLIESSIPEELLRVKSPPMADWLEAFVAMRVHALIRFGRWQDVIALKFPRDRKLYRVTTAMIFYAKGIAHAITGDAEKADRKRIKFVEAVARVGATRTLFNNKCLDILNVAGAMLDGELEYRKGNVDAAFVRLRQAVALEDALPYDEPWGWMQPTRHALGALLLEQGHLEEALAVYSADLGLDDTLPRALQHPNNVWALHGYHECLTRLKRLGEAKQIERQLKLALAIADVPVDSSCFCRLETSCCDITNLTKL